MNIAHFLTILRIAISPVFPILYLGYDKLGIPFVAVPFLMLFFLAISESSDLFDGVLARKRNQVTDLGKVLDPMADSITHISLFITFTQGPVQLSLIFVFIFLYRDFFISTLRTLCALRGVALAARFSGKLKTVLQGLAALSIILMLIAYKEGWISLKALQEGSFAFVGIAALYTVISVWDYIYANRLYIRKAIAAK